MQTNNSKIDISAFFSNRKELETCVYKHLNRKLGLSVGFPHFREGAGGNVCEIETEYLTVNTSSSVCWPLVGEINDNAITKHQLMINCISNIVSELNAHKERLLSDKEKLISKEINLDDMAEKRLK